ncbi:MAG: hypothetical protein ACJAZO_002800 [Myxococcota bacterium]|jgi:hypothetical protein
MLRPSITTVPPWFRLGTKWVLVKVIMYAVFSVPSYVINARGPSIAMAPTKLSRFP